MFELPASIKEINKSFKTTKITTLDKANSFQLKRMFSGSVLVDELTGGGWGYKRRHLLFGQKSSGKNALLSQTIAYNQRLCRKCHKILPNFYNSSDKRAIFLRYVLGLQECKCDLPESKKFLIADYEKSLSIETPAIKIIRNITLNKTGEIIQESEYDEKTALFEILSTKIDISDEEKKELKLFEKWFKDINIEINKIEHDSTKDYLTKCGVIVSELLVCDPEDTEEGIELIMPLIKANDIDGIIWDSVQASLPRYVKERDASQATMGSEPKSNGLLLRHMCAAFASKDLELESEAYKPAFFMTSQMRSTLGSFIVKDSYSGGHVVAHLMDFILELKKESFLKADGTESKFTDTFVGQRTRIRAEKSKISAPGDMFEYDYYFRDGDFCQTGEIDHTEEIVKLGIIKNIIERAGPYYNLSTGDQFKGMSSLLEYMRKEPEFVGNIYKEIRK
jgi:RecA/RadA recombinase